MRKSRAGKLFEIGWVAVSFLFILFWVRSVIHSRFEYPWESWLRLPWSQKLQPFELTLKRYFTDSKAPVLEVVPQLSEADLEKAMRSAADWLLSVQETSGHYKYWYDPVRDQFSPPEDDSFHRQAAASYGLVLAYEMSGDHRYLESAKKSIEYLSGFRRTLEPDKTYYYAERQADLGGAALPMLTMIKLRELTGSTTYDEELKRLARFLIFLQGKYDTGEFKSTYVYRDNYDVEAELGWQSPISPGQAMLALAGMYRDFKDSTYKDSIDRGLKFYSSEKYWKQESFLPWAIPAFVAIHSETGERRYADYVTQMADYLVTRQNLGRNKVFGSFGAFPSITSASYLEGLGDALQLTQDTKDSAREASYRQRAQIGYAWLISLQFGGNNTPGLLSQLRATGGFAASPNDPRIRIDYNMHAISAFVRGLRFIFGRQPVVASQTRGTAE